MYLSPSRTAVVLIREVSRPASGSVTPKVTASSPATIRPRYFSCSSGLPCSMMELSAIALECTVLHAAVAPPPAPTSSSIAAAWLMVAPPPTYSSGTVIVVKPALRKSSKYSWGNSWRFSFSPQYSRGYFALIARTAARMSSWPSVVIGRCSGLIAISLVLSVGGGRRQPGGFVVGELDLEEADGVREGLALRVEAESAGAALPKDAVEKEVQRPQVRQLEPLGRLGAVGEVVLDHLGGEFTRQGVVPAGFPSGHTDIRHAALVTAARVRDLSYRDLHVTP